MAYGGGGDIAFQPSGDAGGEVGGVAGGQEQAGVVAAEVGEEVGGGLEESGGGMDGVRYGGEPFAGRALLRLLRLFRGSRGVVDGWLTLVAGLVAGDGAGDDTAAGDTFTDAAQVAVCLQFAQGGGDAGGALGEAEGEGFDVDAGTLGQRLDMQGEPDRDK